MKTTLTKTKLDVAFALILSSFFGFGFVQTGLAQTDALPAPHFHHLHLNSTHPEAAIDFYTKQFPSTSKTAFDGAPALKSGNVLILFHKVRTPPALAPQTAIWHFGWHVTDVRANLARYQKDNVKKDNVKLLPLYTSDEGGSVWVSSDTWPGTGGVLGLTKAQIADAKTKGVQPSGGAGFAYLQGPDGAIIEYQGNMPAERFNHVHMYWKDPFCAQIWYAQHLNARAMTPTGKPARTEAACHAERAMDRTWPALEREGMYRAPSAGVAFAVEGSSGGDDVTFNNYIQQSDVPLVSTRGHLADHVGLSVENLDAWIAKLRGEGVTFLSKKPYKVGSQRAFMIEGPSKEAIELMEFRRPHL